MSPVTPRDLAFADTAPVRAEGSATVAAPPAEVWAALLDYERWPTWFAGLRTCRATSEPATGVGSTREVTLTGGSRVLERFIAWDEGALWAFTAIDVRPGLMRGLVERATLVDLGDGSTRITYRMAFEPNLALRPLVPVLRRGLPKALTAGMEGLAREVIDRRSRPARG